MDTRFVKDSNIYIPLIFDYVLTTGGSLREIITALNEDQPDIMLESIPALVLLDRRTGNNELPIKNVDYPFRFIERENEEGIVKTSISANNRNGSR